MEWLHSDWEAAKNVWWLVSALIAAAVAVPLWVDRRAKMQVKQSQDELRREQRDQVAEVKETKRRMTAMEHSVEHIDNRLGRVEKSMETVARSEDVSQLREQVAASSAGMQATMKILVEQIHSLNAAALRAGEKGEK